MQIISWHRGETRAFDIMPEDASGASTAASYLRAQIAGAAAKADLGSATKTFAEQIAGFMQTLYPLYLLVFAQQRGTFSGAIPRPYTINAEKQRTVEAFIENGKTAFEAGKAIGKAIKR